MNIVFYVPIKRHMTTFYEYVEDRDSSFNVEEGLAPIENLVMERDDDDLFLKISRFFSIPQDTFDLIKGVLDSAKASYFSFLDDHITIVLSTEDEIRLKVSMDDDIDLTTACTKDDYGFHTTSVVHASLDIFT